MGGEEKAGNRQCKGIDLVSRWAVRSIWCTMSITAFLTARASASFSRRSVKEILATFVAERSSWVATATA